MLRFTLLFPFFYWFLCRRTIPQWVMLLIPLVAVNITYSSLRYYICFHVISNYIVVNLVVVRCVGDCQIADEEKSGQELSYKHMIESIGNNADIDIHCINCEKLKSELQQVKLQIASYAEIVRLMQQENSPDPRSNSTPEIKDNTEPTASGFHLENRSVNRNGR